MPSTTYLQLVQHSLLSYSAGQMFVAECLLVLVAWRQQLSVNVQSALSLGYENRKAILFPESYWFGRYWQL